MEIHGEASTQKGNYQMYHETLRTGNELFDHYPFSDYRRNENRLYNRFLLGFQYTFPGNILWICEYYHQDHGYSMSEWKRLINYAKFLNSQLNTPYGEFAKGNIQVESKPSGWVMDREQWDLSVESIQREPFEATLTIPAGQNGTLRLTGDFGSAGKVALAFRVNSGKAQK